MYDFTPLHDEIRAVDQDYLVGKWCTAQKKTFGPLFSHGLLQFEPTKDFKTRFCFYYTLKQSDRPRLPSPGALDRVLKQKVGVGMTFEEEMVGRYLAGEMKDPLGLETDQGVPCQFHVKMTIADLDAFIETADHQHERIAFFIADLLPGKSLLVADHAPEPVRRNIPAVITPKELESLDHSSFPACRVKGWVMG